MTEYLQLLGLAVSAMLALLFVASTMTALVRGRVKIEPNQPRVVFRENPFRFAGYVLWSLYFASCFAVAAVKIASSLMR